GLPKLAMFLAPGETVDLLLWSDPDPIRATQHAAIRNALEILKLQISKVEAHIRTLALPDSQVARYRKLLSALQADDAELNVRLDALKEILSVAPNDELQSKKMVKLVHAVDRPLAIPRIVRRPKTESRPARDLFHPVVIPIGPG